MLSTETSFHAAVFSNRRCLRSGNSGRMGVCPRKPRNGDPVKAYAGTLGAGKRDLDVKEVSSGEEVSETSSEVLALSI